MNLIFGPIDVIIINYLTNYEFNAVFFYVDETLCALNHQLKHKDVQRINLILEKAQSIYFNQFNDLVLETEIEVKKARSNLDFLKILVEPCLKLEESELPSEIPFQLFEIIHIIRVIWTHSEYYNTRESITGLFRTLSNLIIIFCRNKLKVEKVLAGAPRMGIEIANMSIDCCLMYKQIYKNLSKEHVERNPRLGWDVDYPTIFNQVETFIQRLKDFIEICEAMIVFGRYDEREEIPRPMFGGKRGSEFEKICERIEERFNVVLTTIRSSWSMILEVHNNAWHDEVAKFRYLLRDLEEVVENLMSNVFLNVSNVEEHLEALYALINFSYRKNTRVAFVRHTVDLWKKFIDEIVQNNRETISLDDNKLTLLPAISGRVLLLRSKLDRLTRLMKQLKHAQWLPANPSSAEAFKAYETMRKNVEKNIEKIYSDWCNSMGPADVTARLNRTLMCRSLSHVGLLECNIDRGMLKLLEDSRYFEFLKFQFPAHVAQIHLKGTTIRYVYDSVVTVVLDYNKILAVLSDKERLFFKALIKECDKKIVPGIFKLAWDGELSDTYIVECVKQTNEVSFLFYL